MIVTTFDGGLGNQMFQWACGKNLSIKYNLDLYFDVSLYENGLSKRPLEICNFDKISITNIKEVQNKYSLPIIKEETNFSHFSFPDESIEGFKIEGFWQSQKYFEDINDVVMDYLSIPFDIEDKFLQKYPSILDDSVSLHIRRTDYLYSNGYHVVQPISYYENALDIVGNFQNVFVFSDDIEWCKKNLKLRNSTFIENNTNLEDLWLMSLCKNNIIANSSFSWWSAYLNKNKNKKIICPKNWFGDFTNIDTSLICPNEWIKI